MIKSKLYLFFILSFIVSLNIAQTSPNCKGKNGKDVRSTAENRFEIIEKGIFKCDELVDGQIIYKEGMEPVLYILVFKNSLYKGELDNKTKKIRKHEDQKNKKQLNEDGKFEQGILVTGKKYLYDKDGILFKILIFENGKILGESVIEE
jgi:hypothetical protein